MAASSFPLFLIIPILSFLASTSSTFATNSPSSVASSQLEFWSKNVHGSMPESLFSKLSPLSKHDSDYFSSLVSRKSFSSDASFCSLANLACWSKLDESKWVQNTYNLYGASVLPSSLWIQGYEKRDTIQVDAHSFFRLSILQKGNRVQLPNLQVQFPCRAFLPSHIASGISLSANEFQKIFPESFSSSSAKDAIQTTLQYCNARALKGEFNSCPKSLEDMIRFSQKVLDQKQIVALTSKSTNGSGSEVLIGNIKQFGAEKNVPCHEVFLPFVTYFCHLLSSTRLYSVDLIEPKTRAPVNTILAVCHMDTSAWPRDHVAFKMIKSSPGQAEACHWLTQIDLVWVGDGEGMI